MNARFHLLSSVPCKCPALWPKQLFALVSVAVVVPLYLPRAFAAQPETLPNTQPLTWTGDLSTKMHEASHRDIERRLAESVDSRQKYWHRNTTSPENYSQSMEPNRQHFRKSIGVVDERLPVVM